MRSASATLPRKEYATATGADLSRLREDRAYKESHRPALTAFFQEQVRQRPRLPEEHFQVVVHDAAGMDVLLITGMRDVAPVATFSHLVSSSRVLELRVEASSETRGARRGGWEGDEVTSHHGVSTPEILDSCPSLVLQNDKAGNEDAIERAAVQYLLPLLHENLGRLADMARVLADFPRPGIDFRHILDICQQQGGLELATKLLRQHFLGDWAQVSAVTCCEFGGVVFALPLASAVGLPLALARKAGKLPPPLVGVDKRTSHISQAATSPQGGPVGERIEMDPSAVRRGGRVVVVDDVLATGETLCALLRLLGEAGLCTGEMSVLVVAEFPFHQGRDLLRRRGFGQVPVHSLLICGGA